MLNVYYPQILHQNETFSDRKLLLTMGVLKSKLALIIIVAPWKLHSEQASQNWRFQI